MPCNALFEMLMRCQEFAQIVIELARGQMMDAAQRAQGLAHAEECVSCAARLSDEYALTAGLGALAASEIKLSASVNTEAALLTAFRQKTAPPLITSQPSASRRWPRWAWAAAAAILLALSFIALSTRLDRTPPINVVVLPTPVSTPPVAPRVAPSPDQLETRDEASASQAQQGTLQVSYRRPVNQNKQRSKQPLIRDGLTVYAGDNEVTSDFFSLIYGAPSPLESGQLIRVQMPRAALAAYGLPVNLTRGDAPLKADLLVGEDGQAHAIRLVR